MTGGEVNGVVLSTRNAMRMARNETSSCVTARRTGTTFGHSDIVLDRRKEYVATKGGGPPREW